MSFSVNYAGNGNFTMTVNGKSQTLNLADLNTMLRMEQVAQYDQGIADQLGEIQRTNTKRKALNQLLAKMRQHKAEGRDDDWGGGTKAEQSGTEIIKDGPGKEYHNAKHSERFRLEGEGSTARTVDGWMDYYGITKTDVGHDLEAAKRDSQWDANVNAVKTQIDNITSDSEMQMLRFRQMVDKRGTAPHSAV